MSLKNYSFDMELNNGDTNIILDWDQSTSMSTDTFFFLQYSRIKLSLLFNIFDRYEYPWSITE